MDLCFSGLTNLGYTVSIQRLLDLARMHVARELVIWSGPDQVNRSSFTGVSGVDDALRILEVDFDASVRVSCQFSGRDSRSGTIYSLDVVRERGDTFCRLDGMIVPASGDGGMLLYPDPKNPQLAAQRAELEAITIQAAISLDALLSVADEDDLSLVVDSQPPILAPVLHCAIPRELDGQTRAGLEAVGITVVVSESASSASRSLSLVYCNDGSLADAKKTALRDWLLHQVPAFLR